MSAVFKGIGGFVGVNDFGDIIGAQELEAQSFEVLIDLLLESVVASTRKRFHAT